MMNPRETGGYPPYEHGNEYEYDSFAHLLLNDDIEVRTNNGSPVDILDLAYIPLDQIKNCGKIFLACLENTQVNKSISFPGIELLRFITDSSTMVVIPDGYYGIDVAHITDNSDLIEGNYVTRLSIYVGENDDIPDDDECYSILTLIAPADSLHFEHQDEDDPSETPIKVQVVEFVVS